MKQETKNKMAEIIAAQQAKTNNIKPIAKIDVVDKIVSIKESESVAEVPTETQNLTLKSLQIIWHEGRHIEGATFEGCTFTNWADTQKAFFKLWEVNEKGQDGGYTKVKVELSFNEIEGKHTTRVDITNRLESGDFNPTQEHIFNYIKTEIDSDTESGNYLLDCMEDLRLIETPTSEEIEATTNKYLSFEEIGTLTIADLLGEVKEEDNHPRTGVKCTPTAFELPIKAKDQEEAKQTIFIVDYSEKAFAVIGETKTIKEELKALGGRFNPALKCGAGWIFSKKQLETVKAKFNI